MLGAFEVVSRMLGAFEVVSRMLGVKGVVLQALNKTSIRPRLIVKRRFMANPEFCCITYRQQTPDLERAECNVEHS